jgi:cytochrome c biogenesis protein
MAHYTGLQVSHEPGQWAVWAGCILMALGLATAFYLVHMRIWVASIVDARGRTALWVGGAANKNRDAFKDKFSDIAEKIESELKNSRAKKNQPAACREEHAALVES